MIDKLINWIEENYSLIHKPELYFNPSQLVQYNLRKIQTKLNLINLNEYQEVDLPWRYKIRIRPNENQGFQIWKYGMYDLCLCETIYRLLNEGEVALDIGANIGQMTSVMSAKVGKSGKVISFEPNSDVYNELAYNINLWSEEGIKNVSPQKIALSDHSGTGILGAHEEFEKNRGRSTLITENHKYNDLYDYKRYPVILKTLDEFMDFEQEIGLLKIDVEGHEYSVFNGGNNLLKGQKIRDILFEHWNKYPSSLTDLLESYGYQIFYLRYDFDGLKIGDIKSTPKHDNYSKKYPNYLATNQPERALNILNNKGWQCLSLGYLPRFY